MTETAVEIPGYVAGTWSIDPVHSEVSFVVRHMMVSKVRGRFDKFEGTIVTAADPLQSSVNATVDLSSVNRMVPCPSRSMASTDHLSPTRWRTSRARQADVSPTVGAGSSAGPEGPQAGPNRPESKKSPPQYHQVTLLKCVYPST